MFVTEVSSDSGQNLKTLAAGLDLKFLRLCFVAFNVLGDREDVQVKEGLKVPCCQN